MPRIAVRNWIYSLAVAFVALSAADCSSGDPSGEHGERGSSGTNAGGGATNGSGTGGASDFGNVPNSGTSGDAGMSNALFDAGAIDPGANGCVGQTQSGHPVPVDMYIMLDRSDSMLEATGTGVTKWDAMRSALSMFISDPESDGLSVGLQYFPLGAPGIPETCGGDADCGAKGGSCSNRVCQPPAFATSFTPVHCLTDDDCSFPSPGCAELGVCEADDTEACFNIGAGGCGQDGDCLLLPGECTGYTTCEVGAYSDPAVAIGLLPDNAMPLTTSLMKENPAGGTPTLVALSGAIERVSMHAADNPTHRAIAVLATDGLPSPLCIDPSILTLDAAVTAVANIAADGLASTPSISTYVIGVFSPADETADPAGKVNSIAVAGGTQSAFIVDATQDVAQQLLDALAKIRGGALDCEFELPEAPKGETLDYQQVNVQVTSDGKPRDLFYVRTAEDCGKADFGWYYDVDPASGGTPMQIRVCEQTCTAFHQLPDASVDIKLGCATRGPD